MNSISTWDSYDLESKCLPCIAILVVRSELFTCYLAFGGVIQKLVMQAKAQSGSQCLYGHQTCIGTVLVENTKVSILVSMYIPLPRVHFDPEFPWFRVSEKVWYRLWKRFRMTRLLQVVTSFMITDRCKHQSGMILRCFHTAIWLWSRYG